jgi:hypothetical protein
MSTKPKYIDVEAAEYVAGDKLRLKFSDGVDFGPFILKSLHPDIEKYRTLRCFKSYRVADGNLMWGDYEMIFPVWDLYCGKI